MGLKEKTIHASKWRIGSSLISQVIQLFFSAIMARLLMPGDYGVYGMALVFINFLQIFSSLGMGSALIQKKDATEEHFSSVFWLNLGSGIVLCGIFVLSAPFIALFFHQPVLKNITYLLSLNFIIASLAILQSTLLIREMRFKKIAVVNLIAMVFSGLLGICLALKGFGVWSLVWVPISTNIIVTILMWYKSEWKPKFVFCLDKIREMFTFGFSALGISVMTYFAGNIQDILIGRFMKPAALGYYSMANRIMLLPLQHITWNINGVMFPAFSKIQDELHSVRDAYMNVTFFISVVTFPLMLGLLVVAPEVILTVVGEKWKPVIFLVRILSIPGMFQSIASTTGSILLSQGKARLMFRLTIIGSIMTCLSIAAGLRWGINGVASLYALWTLIWGSITVLITVRLIKLGVMRFLRSLMPATFASAIMILCLMALRQAIRPILPAFGTFLPNALLLLCDIIVGISVYTLSLKLIFPKEFREILSVVKVALPSFKARKI